MEYAKARERKGRAALRRMRAPALRTVHPEALAQPPARLCRRPAGLTLGMVIALVQGWRAAAACVATYF